MDSPHLTELVVQRIGEIQLGRVTAYMASSGGSVVAVWGFVLRPGDGAVLALAPELLNLHSVGDIEWRQPVLDVMTQDLVPLGARFLQSVIKSSAGLPVASLPQVDAEFEAVRLHCDLRSSYAAIENPVTQVTGLGRPTWSDPVDDRFRSTFLACESDSLDSPVLNRFRNSDMGYQSLVELSGPGINTWRQLCVDNEAAGLVVTGTALAEVEEAANASTWEIAYLGVLPKFRGRGLGKRLVAEALDLARTQGAGTMTVDVDTANTPAMNLYRLFGFQEVASLTIGLVDLHRKA